MRVRVPRRIVNWMRDGNGAVSAIRREIGKETIVILPDDLFVDRGMKVTAREYYGLRDWEVLLLGSDMTSPSSAVAGIVRAWGAQQVDPFEAVRGILREL